MFFEVARKLNRQSITTENLIGDRAYDSDPLDEELRNDGIEMIAPHRSNRSKPPTQDRRLIIRHAVTFPAFSIDRSIRRAHFVATHTFSAVCDNV